MRKWYAIEYAYGRQALNRDGNRADRIHQFNSKGERDSWIDRTERAGTDADALPGTHKLVQRAKRYATREPWPISVMSGR